MSLNGIPVETLVEASGKSSTTYGAAPLMTVAGLHMALKSRITTLADRFMLDTKTGARAPSVLDGWLPPKKRQDGKDAVDVERFPFILVRPMQGADTEQSADERSTVTIELLVGTHSDTDDGFLDPLNVIDALRLDLGAKPRIEGTAFTHLGPLTWRLEAARPQWFGIVTTIWQLPRPQRIESEA